MKNIGFLSNTGPDSLENHGTIKPGSVFGHYRPACETPFKLNLFSYTSFIGIHKLYVKLKFVMLKLAIPDEH